MAAFSTEAAVLVKQKALAETRKPKTQSLLKALFSYLAQHKGKTDLAILNLGEISSSTVYTNSSTGVLYAVFVKNRDASAIHARVVDTASAPAATGIDGYSIKIPASDETLLLIPDGVTLANGLSVRADTSASGATNPTTAAVGFAIVG